MGNDLRKCIHCGNTEQEAPLLEIRFRGATANICSACLPVLIHHPERLAPVLPGAENVRGGSHA